MDNTYLDIYNNLIKLTRNKELYNLNKQDTFYDRMIIFFFHLAFLLKINKKTENKQNLQNFFDYCIRQIELSIREIGYGDATINKKMKEYVNLLFSIIDNIDLWETKNFKEKKKILNSYIQDMSNDEFFINYLEKYSKFLSKNTFNKLTKDIITF
tara:strand:- start:135 stop:599 length:465 start_codon:yes stop_codon:yes gene_type:complete